MRQDIITKSIGLILLLGIIAASLAESSFATEPARIRVLSANPANRTYSFACLDNGSGLAGNGVRNWFAYPEDTNIHQIDTTLPANQPFTITFNRDAYWDVSCNVPNPPGLNYKSLYRHSIHIDLRTQLGNPAVIPTSVGPGRITEKCVYNGNGSNYSMSWLISTYGFTGGSGNTVRYSLNTTNSTITFDAPMPYTLYDTHCLVLNKDTGKTIDVAWGVDFVGGLDAAPYIADQYGIAAGSAFAPFDYNTWISLHNGSGNFTPPPPPPINSTGNTTGNSTGNSTGNTTGNITGNITSNTTFSAALSIAKWYPQGLNVVWVCAPTGGSGNFTYDFAYGDGHKQLAATVNNTYHKYPAAGTYNASCTVRDKSNAQAASANMSTTL